MECLTSLAASISSNASIFVPGDASYESLAPPYNHRYANVRPLAIFVPSTVGDVQEAVRWARENDVRVTPRSGFGHNYAGYSNSTGLLIVMSRMRDINWHPSANNVVTKNYGSAIVTYNAGTVTMGAGVIIGDLHPMLEELGHIVPAGTCLSVGIAGLVLGGGIGYSDKLLGLTCDRLVATTVVLADGSVIECSETKNCDLFWACRGGAGNNFGIHTSFTFSYANITGTVAYYNFRWSIKSAVAAMKALQTACLNTQSDHRFHTQIGLGTTGLTLKEIKENAYVNATGQFYGTSDELKHILRAALRVGTDVERKNNLLSIQQVTTAKASLLLSDNPAFEQFASASAILNTPLTITQVNTIVDHILIWPGSRARNGVGIVLLALGGAINEVAANETAFVHRNSLFIMQLNVYWGNDDPKNSPEVQQNWLYNLYYSVFSEGLPQAYQNFPDPYLPRARERYYGTNYPRLRAVKAKYDPTQFFKYPQSIVPRAKKRKRKYVRQRHRTALCYLR